MANEIWAALITGPLAVAVGKLLSEDWRRRTTLGRDMRKALTGTWAGRFHQEVGLPLDQDGTNADNIEIKFKCGWRTVRGTGSYRITVDGDVRRANFRFSGGFLYERFLQLEYKNSKGHIVQFGCVILQLSDLSDRLEGRYAGYGSISNRPVSGSMSLYRIE